MATRTAITNFRALNTFNNVIRLSKYTLNHFFATHLKLFLSTTNLLLALTHTLSFADQPIQLRFDRYLTESGDHFGFDGGVAVVTEIAQDKQGFMWFAEYENSRILRFDGHRFKKFTLPMPEKTRLNNSRASAMIVDHEGVLWIGSNTGLFKYTPQYSRFEHVSLPAKNLDGHNKVLFTSQTIRAMAVGKDNSLYLGYANGLGIIDPARKHTRLIGVNTASKPGLAAGMVNTIGVSQTGLVWVGTTGGGLNQYNPNTQTIKHWRVTGNEQDLLTDNITTLAIGPNDELWLGSVTGGISRLNPNGSFSHYLHKSLDPEGNGHFDVHDIFIDSRQRVWAALDHGGLVLFNKNKDTFTHYKNSPYNHQSISSNLLRKIFEDNQGNLWISAFPSGINYFNDAKTRFRTIQHAPNNSQSLSDNGVLCIEEDSQGGLWFCTENGLNHYDRGSNIFKHYKSSLNNPHSLRVNTIMSLSEDKNNQLWVSTWGGGLHQFNKTQGKFINYFPTLDDPQSFSGLYGWRTFIDKNNTLWVGTENSGLNRYNRKTNNFTHYQSNPTNRDNIASNAVTSLLETQDGSMWVGTKSGLQQLDRNTGVFSTPFSTNKIPANFIRALHEDSQNNLWVGTELGAFVYRHDKQTVNRFSTEQGLPSPVISSIIEDLKGNIWLGTRNGLSKLHKGLIHAKNYDKSDGLAGNNHYHDAAYRDSDGKLYIGSTEGITIFQPESLIEKNTNANVIITELKVNNQIITTESKNSPINKSIEVIKTLELDHTHTMFTFEFALLSYSNSYKNEYAYKLEGFDNNWHHVGRKTEATYTNINAGNYTFKVKAMDNTGKWSDKVATLQLNIIAPPWLQWWAMTLYVLAIIALIYWIAQYRIKKLALIREQESNKKLDQLVNERTEEVKEKHTMLQQAHTELTRTHKRLKQSQTQLVQAEKMSSLGTLVAGVGHELNNPIAYTSIAASNLEREIRKLKNWYSELKASDAHIIEQRLFGIEDNVEIILEGAKRTTGIIHDLRNFSRIDNTEMSLSTLSEGLQSTIKLAKANYTAKVIFDLNIIDDPEICCNPSEVNQVFMNLTINACQSIQDKLSKQENSRSTLTITMKTKGNELEITFHDEGKGFDNTTAQHMLEPFYTTKAHGTGLGLSISYGIITQHQGRITLDSELGNWAQVSLYFPIPTTNTNASASAQNN